MTSLRTPLGNARGLGSAKSGTDHWWTQRVTAVALIPLTLWFVVSLLRLPNLDFLTVRAWLAAPLSSFLAMLLVAVLAFHASLGTAVVTEDYAHRVALRTALLLGLRFLYVVVAGLALLSILRIAFAAPIL